MAMPIPFDRRQLSQGEQGGEQSPDSLPMGSGSADQAQQGGMPQDESGGMSGMISPAMAGGEGGGQMGEPSIEGLAGGGGQQLGNQMSMMAQQQAAAQQQLLAIKSRVQGLVEGTQNLAAEYPMVVDQAGQIANMYMDMLLTIAQAVQMNPVAPPVGM